MHLIFLYSKKLNYNEKKVRNLYKILRSLTKLKDANPMPLMEPPSDLPDKFADFFINKIKKIREQFCNQNTQKNTTGNAQVSIASCHWIEKKYST